MKQEIIIEKIFDLLYAEKYYELPEFNVGDRCLAKPDLQLRYE